MRFVLLVLLVLLAGPAFGQMIEPESTGPDLMTTILAGVTAGVGAAVLILKFVAPLTKTDKDDKALALLERWADPNDPAVPPSPSNPSGIAK